MFTLGEEMLEEEEAYQMTCTDVHTYICGECSMCIFSLKVVLSDGSNSIVKRKEKEKKEMTESCFFFHL